MNTPQRALCVSIHDVASPTWTQCLQLIAALREVGDFPLGLLLVPRWHGHRLHDDPAFIDSLQCVLDAHPGHELLLHGLYHRDDAPAPGAPLASFQRCVLARGEAEFAALTGMDAYGRVRTGLADLHRSGLRDPKVQGFVPPAWLMSRSARAALAEQGSRSGLRYLSLFTGLLDLRDCSFVRAPVLVYSARSLLGDAVLRTAVGGIARLMHDMPLLRLGLHPADIRRPQNVRHAQRLIAHALRDRAPSTEGQWLHDHMRKFRACRQADA